MINDEPQSKMTDATQTRILAEAMIHDLGNTLAAISLAAYNIRKIANDSRMEESLNTITAMVSEAYQIINNIPRSHK